MAKRISDWQNQLKNYVNYAQKLLNDDGKILHNAKSQETPHSGVVTADLCAGLDAEYLPKVDKSEVDATSTTEFEESPCWASFERLKAFGDAWMKSGLLCRKTNKATRKNISPLLYYYYICVLLVYRAHHLNNFDSLEFSICIFMSSKIQIQVMHTS